MSKFLHTWVWVHSDNFKGGTMWMKGSGWWRETFINLDEVKHFCESQEVDGRDRTVVNYRDDDGDVIGHTLEQLQGLLVEFGHLIPHELGKTAGDSDDEP